MKFFLVFILLTAVHLGLIYFLYPETKRRSLEDIAQGFGEEVVHCYGAEGVDERMYREAGVGGADAGGKEGKRVARVNPKVTEAGGLARATGFCWMLGSDAV